MSNHIGHVWFTSQKTVGIVLAHDPITDKLKAWIAPVGGSDSAADIEHIMGYGAKFPIDEAISLINNHGSWNLETTEEVAAMTAKEGAW